MKNRMALSLIFSCAFACAQQPNTQPAWIQTSNQDAKILLDVMARFNPEAAARSGVEGVDENIIDLGPQVEQRRRAALETADSQIKEKLAAENDPNVREDLQILVHSADQNIRGIDLDRKYEIPYYNLAETIYGGIHALLDEQIAASRRPAALVRLRKYVGMQAGSTPLVNEAEALTRERLNSPGLIGPYKGELEQDLANQSTYIEGVGKLFKQFNIAGYEEPYARLQQQMTAYQNFLKSEILPRARTDFRLPAELYAYRMERVGVDIPPGTLAAIAHDYYNDIQAEMITLAPLVAREHHFPVTDYRGVIRELKKDQWSGPSILPNYEKRTAEIEQIIRENHLVTMPERPLKIELGSAAESAQTPAPHMRPPRLIGNTGESGVFVLPLRIPAKPGSKPGATQQFDDFTFDAASWTLIAHEGRPGHELQFDTMAQNGVPIARAIFAFNSVNAEGWGLYSEAIMRPFMPDDGRLISLQLQLLRAARAFLDPELQEGKVTPQQARDLLQNDVVLSPAFANSEVDRYMFWAPGQATSYFYGYTQLMRTRAEAEKALGSAFNQQQFHDFILDQGLLPPPLLRKAVMERFVPAHLH